MNFVTITGDAWVKPAPIIHKRVSLAAEKYHKGFRVVGLPPGSIEEAKADHERERQRAISDKLKKIPPEFNEASYIATAKAKPVRSKPYELAEAAAQCAEIARRCGWLRVEVIELKKDGA